MALFHAAALLDDAPTLVVVTCDFFKIPDGESYPTIELTMTDRLRDVYRRAEDRYRFAPRYTFGKDSQTPVGEISNDPVQFCYEILKEGYAASEGLIDEPSKKAVLALVKREPGFARKLAAKLVEVFEHDELFQEEASDEKN